LARGLLITLVIFTGISTISLLRDLVAFCGIFIVLFQEDFNEAKKLLRNPDAVVGLGSSIFSKMKPAEPPPPTPIAEPTPPPPIPME